MNLCTAALAGETAASANWKDFVPAESKRRPETIEWSISYTYNAPDEKAPRVLLIGDSVANGYHRDLREKLGGKINLSLWATSKCVTDKNYLHEMDCILDSGNYSLILFNNGLHSLRGSPDWEIFYRATLRFIRAKAPRAKISIVLSTPLRTHTPKAKRVTELNKIARKIAADEKIPVADLFSLMDPKNRKEYWNDEYHFRPVGIKLQANAIAKHILDRLDLTKSAPAVQQMSTETGPSGALK